MIDFQMVQFGRPRLPGAVAGSDGDEPALHSLVYNYYRAHCDHDLAVQYRDQYFRDLERQIDAVPT